MLLLWNTSTSQRNLFVGLKLVMHGWCDADGTCAERPAARAEPHAWHGCPAGGDDEEVRHVHKARRMRSPLQHVHPVQHVEPMVAVLPVQALPPVHPVVSRAAPLAASMLPDGTIVAMDLTDADMATVAISFADNIKDCSIFLWKQMSPQRVIDCTLRLLDCAFTTQGGQQCELVLCRVSEQ